MGNLFQYSIEKHENEGQEVANIFLESLLNCIENDAKSYTPSPTYKPSLLKCVREMFFVMNEVIPESTQADYQLIGIAENGTDRHIRLQNYFTNMKKFSWVDIEHFIVENNLEDLQVKGVKGGEVLVHNKKYNMNFMTDGIIKYNDKCYIVEIKTETSRKFYDRYEVDPAHYNQASCYAISFNIDEVIFLYENRDTLDKKTFLLKVTDEMKNKVVNMIEECNYYLKKEEIPPKPDTEGGKLCVYCKYRRNCRGVK